MKISDPSTVAAAVRAWHHGRYRATRSDRARQILTEIMPNLLVAFGKTTEPDAAFIRFDRCLAEQQGGVRLLSVFQANPDLLDLVAEIMGDAPRLADHLARNPALLDYVRVALQHESREQFRILFLDKKNQLIADEIMGHGTVDHAPVYPREVIKRSLELAASAIILVHNHPSGDPTPSQATST